MKVYRDFGGKDKGIKIQILLGKCVVLGLSGTCKYTGDIAGHQIAGDATRNKISRI